ncbi:zinc finger MYM-type protein 5-like [Xyrauchen texanus]|uniref:zinc finger MYM-type protein 5-like n=1 Tax=Xyrauchen texanus TaxID=154827 RepID=UPI00224270F6|nr:zinc finger MYM-type protein 5-like [Xyrauchen texanus]
MSFFSSGALLKYFGTGPQTTSTDDTASPSSSAAVGHSGAAATVQHSGTEMPTGLSGTQVLPLDTSSEDEAGPSSPGAAGHSGAAATLTGLPHNVPTSTMTASSAPSSSPSGSPIDPADWPSHITDTVRVDMVISGPIQVNQDFVFPKRQNRGFHHRYMFRPLVNGEKIRHSWLMYSENKDAVYCFCCKLFTKFAKLNTVGQQDWMNIGTILGIHENSTEHVNNLKAWKELELRLKTGKTIDQTEIDLLEAEKRRWREVLI